MRIQRIVLLCLLALFAWSRPAHAARGTDACTGYITSLPATIDSAGTWCLKQNLSIAFAPIPQAVQAIYVETYDVTIDCNDFKIEDTFPNSAQTAWGIRVGNVLRTTVRHCGFKGFNYGIDLQGPLAPGGAFLVEDNRVDGSVVGIAVSGAGSVVRRNQVLHSTAFGISAGGEVDILDNTVSGVTATTGSNGRVVGIGSSNTNGSQIANNDVRGLAKDGSGAAYALDLSNNANHVTVRNNTLVGDGSSGSTKGLYCASSSVRAQDNVIAGFATAIDTCGNAGGNDISP